MRNILKVFIWAIVAAAAVALWLAGLYVPQIESFGFPLGIVYCIAIFGLMEGADRLRRQSDGVLTNKKHIKNKRI